MISQRYHLPILGHASYVVACPTSRRGIVLDARLDIETYLEWAIANDVDLVACADTHAHADYVSGITRLIEYGLRAWGTAEGGVTLAYEHTPLRHGNMLEVGTLRITALHVPGHTPEHLAYFVTSGNGESVLFSGGSLLCGDIGRPDLTSLPDVAAGVRPAMAVALRSLRDVVLPLGDDVVVRPTHVAGTLCAGSLSEDLETTIGHERRTNPCLLESAELREIDAAHLPQCALDELDRLPPKPAFWASNRMRNIAGTVPNELPPRLHPMTATALAGLTDAGVLVLDVRSSDSFGVAHVPGSISIATSAFGLSLAGVLTGDEHEVVLVAEDELAAVDAAWNLRRIGVECVIATLDGGFAAWQAAGLPSASVTELDIDVIGHAEATVLDVRMPSEWASGTIPGALLRSGLDLLGDASPLPAGTIAVVCEGGSRSMSMTSWLLSQGHHDVCNVPAGMSAWNGQPATPTTV